MNHAKYQPAMREAISLAIKGNFKTAPNPCVGAVLIRDGINVAGGFHQHYGGAHAEVNAIAEAVSKGINPADCTMVVTLEPCNHYGKTPPCTEAILASGIRRVVIGSFDPTPNASGGLKKLQDSGVEVISGVLKCECDDLIADFITWQKTDLPYTILKLASTMDGRIATRTGHSRWISCEETLRLTHTMRRHAGALLVGGNTFYNDDPQLTCRPGPDEPPVERQPLAVVVTSRLPSPDMPIRLLQERPSETIFWTTLSAATSPKAEALREKGVTVLGLPPLSSTDDTQDNTLNLYEGLASLRRDHGCLYVVCEGGGRLGLSLLEKNLVSELRLHLAPRILADNEAIPLFSGLSPLRIDEGIQLRITDTKVCGEDLIATLRPKCLLGCKPTAN